MPCKIQILEDVFWESEVFIWWWLLLRKCLGVMCCSLLFHLVLWNFLSSKFCCLFVQLEGVDQTALLWPLQCAVCPSLQSKVLRYRFPSRCFLFCILVNHVTQLYNAGGAYLSAQDSWAGGAFCPPCRPPNHIILLGPFQSLWPGCSFQEKPGKEGGNSWNQLCTPHAHWGSLSTGKTLQTTLYSLHWRDFLELSRWLLQGKL